MIVTESMMYKMAALRSKGKNISQIAKTFGLSRQLVRERLSKFAKRYNAKFPSLAAIRYDRVAEKLRRFHPEVFSDAKSNK